MPQVMPILYDVMPETFDRQCPLSELEDEGVSYISLPFVRRRSEEERHERVRVL